MVFWDIDGTLIRRAGPHHRKALIDSVRRATGLETSVEGIPLHGMLDPDILSAMMKNAGAGAADIRRAMPRIARLAQAQYARTCPNLERKVCPGVRTILKRLGRAGVPMGIVSGNFPRIGWMKVERAGLRDHFRIAAFAGMARDRAALLRLAIRRSRERGWINRRSFISLVGDTPRDVDAARANGAFAVAVATGLSSREELEAARPDVLVDDLRQLSPETLWRP